MKIEEFVKCNDIIKKNEYIKEVMCQIKYDECGNALNLEATTIHNYENMNFKKVQNPKWNWEYYFYRISNISSVYKPFTFDENLVGRVVVKVVKNVKCHHTLATCPKRGMITGQSMNYVLICGGFQSSYDDLLEYFTFDDGNTCGIFFKCDY